jgi:hypothetical protein
MMTHSPTMTLQGNPIHAECVETCSLYEAGPPFGGKAIGRNTGTRDNVKLPTRHFYFAARPTFVLCVDIDTNVYIVGFQNRGLFHLDSPTTGREVLLPGPRLRHLFGLSTPWKVGRPARCEMTGRASALSRTAVATICPDGRRAASAPSAP